MRLKKASKKKGTRKKAKTAGGTLTGQRSAVKSESGEVTAEHASALLLKGFQKAEVDARLFSDAVSLGFTLNLGNYSSIKLNVHLGGRFDVDATPPSDATTLLTNECILQLNAMCEQVGISSFDRFVERNA